MKFFSVAMMSTAVVTGLAGAGLAYEIASAGADGANASVTDTPPADDATTMGVVKPKTRWAPCEPPAVLEGRQCVTDVVRTVVLPAPATRRGVTSSPDDDGDDADDVFDDHGEDTDDGEDHTDSDDGSEDHADDDDDDDGDGDDDDDGDGDGDGDGDHADDGVDDSRDSDGD